MAIQPRYRPGQGLRGLSVASPALASAPPELPPVIASSVEAGPPPTPSASPGGPGLKQMQVRACRHLEGFPGQFSVRNHQTCTSMNDCPLGPSLVLQRVVYI